MRVKLVDPSRRLDILKFEYSSIYTDSPYIKLGSCEYTKRHGS
jgi:hypothetical protein